MRRARWKRKSVRDELAAHGPTHPYEGAAGTNCCQHESLLPAALKIRRWPKCVPASGGKALVGLQRGHPLLLFSLPLPHPQEGFPKGRGLALVPRPLGGWFPKAGAKAPGLCVVSRGAGGNRNPPAFLFRGAGGDILFSKENIPLGFCRESRPSVGADGFI